MFQPVSASAGVTPGIKPDFSLRAGDTAAESYDAVLLGSVEVKGQPQQCRNEAPYNLTCAAHRIKLQRTPGAKLSIVLEWDAQAANVLSVPDVDMFLFDGPTSQFDSTVIGGAGGTLVSQAVSAVRATTSSRATFRIDNRCFKFVSSLAKSAIPV